jgi:hypothetical protein
MTRILRENEVEAATNDADDDGDERGEQRYADVKGRRKLLMLEDTNIFIGARRVIACLLAHRESF